MPILPNTHALRIGIADYQHINRLPQQVRDEAKSLTSISLSVPLGVVLSGRLSTVGQVEQL